MSSSLASITEALIGQNMNAHPDCLGIYIGIDEMYVAQTTKKDSGTVLESLVRVPINSVDKTLLKPTAWLSVWLLRFVYCATL